MPSPGLCYSIENAKARHLPRCRAFCIRRCADAINTGERQCPGHSQVTGTRRLFFLFCRISAARRQCVSSDCSVGWLAAQIIPRKFFENRSGAQMHHAR